ncbi:MAG TPA: UvrD-helicase domain-containing protein [Verrucomicrobiota bacterium]|nr:UvrD-helicase domain-containing protein [Verrucomicrobiota bacterium]HRZ36209.1 UvrD-helicase domain-containing protein [Candidatus Paceibacterota bacterium]
MPGLTSDQQRAIEAVGDVLVVAGAGTGKTSTLVERCVRRILDPEARVSLDAVLLVTFTEAAASEMRRRIRQRLEQALEGAPEDRWIAEQLALVDSARISTLHSFCLHLVRDHFQELGLDPEFTVLDEAQRAVLVDDVLTRVFEGHYAGTDEADRAVQELVFVYGGASDETIRRLVLRAHDFTCTLPDPEAWLAREESRLRQEAPAHWTGWFERALDDWAAEWTEALAEFPPENLKAVECLEVLRRLGRPVSHQAAFEAFKQIEALDRAWPHRKKTAWRKPLEPLLEEAAFLSSLIPCEGAIRADSGPNRARSKDPLREDWDWVRAPLMAMVALVREFGGAFARAKHELAAVDFHDLEQFALRLLWDSRAECPTPLAESLRLDLAYVFVDEYQDINAAQDRIVTALSRPGSRANRFLVGDVKQSIYRFRLAAPRIFQGYADAWGGGGSAASAVSLTDNFRSHEAILRFVNALFPLFMRREIGGVEYGPAARLRFGDPEARRPMAWRPAAADSSGREPVPGDGESPRADAAAEGRVREEARVEVHVRIDNRTAVDSGGSVFEGAEDEGAGERTGAEQEAALVAARLRALRDREFAVWSAARRDARPVSWGDMVILLRSPRNKAEAYAKVFEAAGVPLVAARRGLYDALEISDLLSLLEILDNPLQDIPLLAVLRSPLVGLTVTGLALVRLGQRSGPVWAALQRFHKQGPDQAAASALDAGAVEGGAWMRVDRFLARYERWRRIARRVALSQCLETVLDETHYEARIEVEPRGAQRRANVQRLLALTRQFDRFQRQGLFRFLRFVEAQRAVEFEPEPAVTEARDAVRLMSIHQSKGLEFPVVVVPDLGKRFNFDDTRGPILIEEELGFCPMVRPAGGVEAYPSLPHWLASRRERHELLGEEIRLLYVAATRACDKLILVGSVSAKRAEAGWPFAEAKALTARQIGSARCGLDWLGPVLTQLAGSADWLDQGVGQRGCFRWVRHDQPAPLSPPTGPAVETTPAAPAPAVWTALEGRLTWQYPWRAATVESAKTAVTTLRRRVTEETDRESRRLFPIPSGADPSHARARESGRVLTAAERGTAYHRFLESAALDTLARPDGVRAEVARLEHEGVLSGDEAAVLDLGALGAFGQSELGRRVIAERQQVRRELDFTLRLSPEDFERLAIPITRGLGADEFIIVQGVVDLAVMVSDQIWIVDFKTDDIATDGLQAKVESYAPQLRLYALALSRIYRRPVTEAWLYFFALGRAEPVPTYVQHDRA